MNDEYMLTLNLKLDMVCGLDGNYFAGYLRWIDKV